MTLFYSKECRRALLFISIVEPNKVFLFTNGADDVPKQSLMLAVLSWPLNVFSHSTRDCWWTWSLLLAVALLALSSMAPFLLSKIVTIIFFMRRVQQKKRYWSQPADCWVSHMACPKIGAGSCKPHCHFFEVVCRIITERHTGGIFFRAHAEW